MGAAGRHLIIRSGAGLGLACREERNVGSGKDEDVGSSVGQAANRVVMSRVPRR